MAVALFVGYMIYSILMGMVLEHFGITSPGTVDMDTVTIMTTLPMFFSLMGEEFIKFIPFMF